MWILVTGFGPFDRHSTNPSWLAVSNLPALVLVDGVEVEVVKQELLVSYRQLDLFYKTLDTMVTGKGPPLLILHVGVAGGSSKLRLEQYAYNQTIELDVEQYEPPDHLVDARDERGNRLGTRIDLVRLQDWVVGKCDFKAQIEVSQDAGRYLCNAAYYKACRWSNKKALFVHVPEEDQPHIKELTQLLHWIILGILQN
jgi:pyroglutamyl-peptidase